MDQVGKENKKSWSGSGVYNFIRDLIVEGKDAWLVDDKGRFRINWLTAPMLYHTDFKSRTDEIDSRKASNNLRSALLNSYEEDGAKEFIECQKKNAKAKIIERQFQMPSRIFESLFIEAGKSSQNSTLDSPDTGDEAMDITDDLFSTSELDTGQPIFGISTYLPLDSTRNEPAVISTPFEIFDIPQEELKKTLDDYGQREVMEGIFPAAGSIEGGQPFTITLAEKLPCDRAYVADFDGVGVVNLQLEKFDSSTFLTGFTPSTRKTGSVRVTVKTEDGQLLGTTSFQFVDSYIQEVLKQMVDDQGLQSLFVFLSYQKHGINRIAQFVDELLMCK